LEKEQDFSNHPWFPGTAGNPFDIVLHKFEKVQQTHFLLFGAFLFLLAALASLFSWPSAFFLWLFFLNDWLLLSLLPTAGVSYGPPKPPVLVLAGMRMAFALLTGPYSWIFQALGTAMVMYGFWWEPLRLQVTFQKLVTEKLPPHFSIRILHLGDLHVERPTSREKKITQKIAELKPDLILFSGDILNLSYLHDPQAQEAARSLFQAWQAPLGTYLVSGSPAVDLPEILPGLLENLPVTWLKGQKVTIVHGNGSFDLIGLECTHRPHVDGPILENLLSQPGSSFKLLLYHSPDLAPLAARQGIDLQLSGHTHGGQIRLPWFGALFTGCLYGKRFEAGRYLVENLTLYITRGIGLEGSSAPRVRFLCRPEVILWEISGK
jgi:predicted MPP superfamily phosphohydrolase